MVSFFGGTLIYVSFTNMMYYFWEVCGFQSCRSVHILFVFILLLFYASCIYNNDLSHIYIHNSKKWIKDGKKRKTLKIKKIKLPMNII